MVDGCGPRQLFGAEAKLLTGVGAELQLGPADRRLGLMANPVLLYDGACGLCTRTVRFILRHDRRKVLRFASLDGGFARSVVSRHPGLRNSDSVVWYEPREEHRRERILTRSDAALQVLRYLGGTWRMGLVAAVVPRSWRDLFYRLVARHRRRLFPPVTVCLPASADERPRFLE